MYKGKPCDRTKDGAHSQVITNRERLLVDLDEEKAKAHDRDSDPGEYPHDCEGRVRHDDHELRAEARVYRKLLLLDTRCLPKI